MCQFDVVQKQYYEFYVDKPNVVDNGRKIAE